MRLAASVVLYHPDFHLLRRTLAPLANWPHGPVYVHANAGSEELAEALRELLPQAFVSFTAANLGFAGGHNRLLADAFGSGARAVLVHNPDLILDPAAPGELLAVSAAMGDRALLGPALQLADPASMEPEGLVDSLGMVWTRGCRHLDRGQGEQWVAPAGGAIPVAGISGACLFVPHPVYARLVGATGEFFDEEFLAYREDAELAFRSSLLGVPSMLVPTAHGLHGRSLRGTLRGTSVDVDRLGVRNRFLIAFKYGRHRPGGLVGPLLRDVVVLLGVVLKERASWSGVSEAWQLRHKMRAKGKVVLSAACNTTRQASGL